MKKIICLIIIITGGSNLFSQSNSISLNTNDSIYSQVDTAPKFKSGDVYAWLSQHIIYPKSAVDSGIEGKVFVSFVVEKNGSVSHVKLLYGGDTSLNKEALRVVSDMPPWEPGRLKHETVRVKLMLPIYFKLISHVVDKDAYKIYCDTCIQQPPQFSQELWGYLSKHMRWSKEALRNKAQGKVTVGFIIEKDGSLSHIVVENYEPGASMLEDDARRVIYEMTNFNKWTPGYNDGHPVRVKKSVTFNYVMGPDQEKYKVYKFDK